MNSIMLDLGIIQIKWYSFFIFTAMFTAYFLISKEAKKKKIKEDYLINLIFYGIIIGVIGARFYYVLFNLNYYLNNFIEIFLISNGGLAIHGGIIAALIFIILYCKNKNINIFLMLDIIVVGVIIAQAIGRWGNFTNSEAYGGITSLTNLKSMHIPNFIIEGMFINGHYRQPTFLYESILSFICFFIMIFIRKIKKLKVGMLTSIYLMWYGIERLIIETFRSDSLMLGNLKIAQLVSFIFILSGIVLLIISYKKNKLYNEESFN